MNYKTTIVMAVLVIAGLVYVLTVERKLKTTEQAKEAAKKVFADFKSEQGDRLQIARKTKSGKEETIEVQKIDSDHWRMVKPLSARADKSEINSLLSEFEFMEKVGTIKPEQGKPLDLKEYGLDKPQITATFYVGAAKKKAKKGKHEAKPTKQYKIMVGKKTAVGHNVYIQLAGNDEVYAVADTLLDKLKKKVNALRDKKVCEVDKSKVEKLKLDYADKPDIVCSQTKEGWKLEEPVADLGNKDEIDKLLDKIKDLKVDEDGFISENPTNLAQYGLDKPKLTATVFQKGVAVTILLGKKVKGKTDKIYAKRKDEPTILAVKKDILDDLAKKPNDLRDKKVVRIQKDDVKKLQIQLAKGKVTLEKKGDDWNITEPKQLKADNWEVGDFIESLGKLEVDAWVAEQPKDLKTYGLDKPAAVITAELKDKKGTKKLLLGKRAGKEGERWFAKRGDQNVILRVAKKDFYDQALAGYLTFRNRLILDFSKSNAKKLTVVRPDKMFVCSKQKVGDEEKWMLSKPMKIEGDTNNIDDILWDLSYLKAKKLVEESPKDLKKYGLDKPRIQATVVYDEEVKSKAKKDKTKDKEAEKKKKMRQVTKTLLVGKPVGADKDKKNAYAMLKGGDLVFVVESSVVKNLQDELVTRRICKLDKDDVRYIVLEYPGKIVRYEKKNGEWKMVKPKAKKASKSDIDDILNKIEDFRADSIAAYSAKNPGQYGLTAPRVKLTLGLKQGEKTIVIGANTKKDKDKFYLEAPPSDFVYIVEKYDVDKLMKEKPEQPKAGAKKKTSGKKGTGKDKGKAKPGGKKTGAGGGKEKPTKAKKK